MGQFHRKAKNCMKTFNFDYDNVAGIVCMYAIPVDSVTKLHVAPVTKEVSLNLKAWEEVIQIPVYKGDSFKTEEKMSIEEGGCVWNVTVSGIIPKRCRLSEQYIALLEHGEWLALTQDANGVVVLWGTVEVPLLFTHSRSTGTTGEMNGAGFTFSGKEPVASYILSSFPE